MKFTWFGTSAFRIHVGGAIVVVEPEAAGTGIDPAELVSGADLVVRFGEEKVLADSIGWKPRPPLRPLEADEENRAPEIAALGSDCLVINADGEAPLVIACGNVPVVGKWADKAVIVLCGTRLSDRGAALLDRISPSLIALAGEEAEVDAAFAQLRDRLDGTGMIALERALAVEV